MLINLFYELKKYEDISYADPPQAVGWSTFPSSPTDRRPCCACVELPNPTFWQEIFRHSKMYGNKLHKVKESAASVVDDKHQAGEG